tara:strand:+ start:1856 stop:2626 length:771 start_codon:yes stop_codon:yes gene_type:complete
MKNCIFTLLISIVLFSCKNEGCTDPLAINFDDSSNKNDGSCEYLYNLDIRFSLNDNETKLVKNDIISFENNSFRIEKFKLFFSEISVANSTNTENISEVFLYNLENENTYNITASISQNNFTEFNFGIGLNETQNSTTPADYETDHPLGIDNDTHWTMSNSNSYIFALIEGKLDTIGDGSFFNRTYHLAHNDLLRNVSLQKDIIFNDQLNETIEITIELKEIFEGIDLSATIPHQSDNSPLAHQIMDNINNAFEVQ